MKTKLPILGILGGMGPVVTAEFLKSIYEYNPFIDKEQEAPNVIVFSFPSAPDRTGSIDSGKEREFIDFIQVNLEHLNKLADCIVRHDPLSILRDIEALLEKYNTRSYISGCTEFHLLTKSLKLKGIDSIKAIDPLSTIAQNFSQLIIKQAQVDRVTDCHQPSNPKSP